MTTALYEPGLPLEALWDGSWAGVELKGTDRHTRSLSAPIFRGGSFK